MIKSYFFYIVLIAPVLSHPLRLESFDAGTFAVPIRPHDTPISANHFDERGDQGQYHFGFSHGGQVRSEYKDVNGNIYGYYSYLRHTGEPTVVFYNAGDQGFRVSSNHLPIAGNTEGVVLPFPVEDTPAVAEAKKRFLALYNEVEARNRNVIGV